MFMLLDVLFCLRCPLGFGPHSLSFSSLNLELQSRGLGVAPRRSPGLAPSGPVLIRGRTETKQEDPGTWGNSKGTNDAFYQQRGPPGDRGKALAHVSRAPEEGPRAEPPEVRVHVAQGPQKLQSPSHTGAYHSSAQEAEAGSPQVQVQGRLQSEFESSLG